MYNSCISDDKLRLQKKMLPKLANARHRLTKPVLTCGCLIQETLNAINLVADTAGYHTFRIDTNLNNAWGMAINDEGSHLDCFKS